MIYCFCGLYDKQQCYLGSRHDEILVDDRQQLGIFREFLTWK